MNAIYVSLNSFTIVGDKTSEFVIDRRVKLNCGTDGTKYATVVSSSYSSPNTTVTMNENTLTNKLVSVLYGIIQPGEYGSLPDHSHDGIEGSGGAITTFSGTSIHVDGDATVTGTMYAHVYDSYSPIHIKDDGTTAMLGDGAGTIDFPAGATVYGNTLSTSADLATTSGTLQTNIDAKPDTEVFLTEGVPSELIGKANDIAIDQNTGDIYEKVPGSTSVTVYPAVSGDDGYVATASFNNSGLQLYFGNFPGSYHTFIRFPNITIGQGSTITSAYVRFKAYGNRSGTTCNLNVYFNNVDAAVAPTTEGGFNNLVLTDAVAWNNVSGWTSNSSYNSPELSTILQTVIDRESWSSNNAVQVLIKDNGSSAGAVRDARSYDDAGGANKPELHITYSTTALWTKQYDNITITDLSTMSGTLQANIDGLDYYTTGEVDTISGSLQTNIDAKPNTFLDLTDTPNSYIEIDGNYLRTTASGITTVSGIVLKAPDDSEWLICVTASGVLYTTAV